MKRILFLSSLAIVWFVFVPIWDAMFNKNHLDAALVHFFTHTWMGGITMVVGLFLALVMSVVFFVPKKRH